MDVLFILIPISLCLAICALGACVWAIRSGQYEDTQSPAQKLVLEDHESFNRPEPSKTDYT